jgi:hypothetical protein
MKRMSLVQQKEGRNQSRRHDTHDRGGGRKKRMDEKRLNGKRGLEPGVYCPHVEGHVI